VGHGSRQAAGTLRAEGGGRHGSACAQGLRRGYSLPGRRFGAGQRPGLAGAYGYRFTTPDRVIVISGDAAPDANIEAFAKGADILLHEVYSVSGFARRNEFWQKYHRNNHTSAHELGEIATRVQPRLLVLYHVLFWGSSEEVVLDEVREKYSGRVVLGRDLDVY
jgi:ribonuclease BN (tRNA processing enzyme)